MCSCFVFFLFFEILILNIVRYHHMSLFLILYIVNFDQYNLSTCKTLKGLSSKKKITLGIKKNHYLWFTIKSTGKAHVHYFFKMYIFSRSVSMKSNINIPFSKKKLPPKMKNKLYTFLINFYYN